MRALIIMTAALGLGGLVGVVGADDPSTTSAPAAASQPSCVSDAYPGLASSGLAFARLADLPKGAILRAGDLSIAEKDVDEQIAKAPPAIQRQLKKNGFFLLEQMATGKLLLAEAKRELAKAGKAAGGGDRAVIGSYLGLVTQHVQVSDEQIKAFYDANKDAVGGASFQQVKPQIAQYLLREKKQESAARHVEALGRRTLIEVSASWVKAQAVLAADNPVGMARRSGRPSLVDFGADGCRPCDLMAPILAALKTEHAGRLNVVFVHVRKEQVLAARYGIRVIPVQVFFDKSGKEVFRHTGFYAREDIAKKLAEMGVR